MKKIEINLQRPSKDLLNGIVASLLDYLLYSRSQIPFHFELFKKFIENKNLSVSDNARKNDWKTEKQIKLATETVQRISSLKEVKSVMDISKTVKNMLLFQDYPERIHRQRTPN